MRYRKLSEDGDYTFGNGQKDFWRDEPDAVAQSVKTRLLLWLGEWFLDIGEGTPFLQGILGKYSEEQANITIQDRVVNTTGVTNIETYESLKDVNNRALSVTMTLNTIYGPTDLEISNYVNY